MRRIAPLGLAALLAVSFSASAMGEESAFRASHALLDPSPQERPQELSVWLGLPWYYGLGIGVGVRYEIPIVKNGFIPRINNAFGIEFGGDIAYTYPFGGYYLIPIDVTAAARWTFYLTPKFAAYGKLGIVLGYAISSYNGLCTFGSSWCSGVYPAFDGEVGIIFHISDSMSLRAELGDMGLRVGLGFDL